MNCPSRRLAASVAGVLAAGAAVAWAGEPTEQDARIKALEAKVAELEAKQATNSKDLASTIEAVLRDAERRSQLMAAGSDMGAGYDEAKGFYIQSGKDFYLHPNIQFQPRYVANWRQDAKADGDDSIEDGFELRRLKLAFDGHVLTPNLTYGFIWATDRQGGGLELEEAWTRYMFNEQFGVRGGQFKDPLAHEGLVSSKRLLAADRTFLDNVIGRADNYVQGVSVIFQEGKDGAWRTETGFTDGIGSANTDFLNTTVTSSGAERSTNFGLASRVEYKVFGDWKSYDDFTALGNKNNMLVFGAGVDWTEDGDTDVLTHTADAQWENNSGLALYGAFLARARSNETDLYDWGAMAQAAYLLNKQWEVFARYDFTRLDPDGLAADREGDVHEITAGINYYIRSHIAKFTVDLTWLPNGSPQADLGSDILESNDEDEILLRAQFQLLI